MGSSEKRENKKLSTVDRALSVIEYLAECGPAGAPLGEIAAAVESNKATTHHTLGTLKTRTWVEQDSQTGNYFLGDGVAPLVRYTTRTEMLKETLHPALVAISLRLNELVHAGVLAGDHVRYIDKVEPDRAIRVVSFVGREVPAPITALGRALLGGAGLSEDQINWYLERVPESGPALRESFVENLERVRTEGWSYEQEENEAGIACVGVPLYLPDGRTAAVSVSAPAERLPFERAREVAQGMAEELSALPASSGITVSPALSGTGD